MGTISSVHDLERAIGILSYCRCSIIEAGRILAPLYQTLTIIKKEGATDLEWEGVQALVETAFDKALKNVKNKKVLGR